MTEKPDAQADAPAAAERIVIRDKRKVSTGQDGKPDRPEEQAASGAASTAAAPEAGVPEEEPNAEVAEEPEADEPAVEGEVVEATEVAQAPGAAPPKDAAPKAELGELRSALDERTSDLQRVTAEYANYRKRVERDRAFAADQATGAVLSALLPLLDDIDRAREHGDLNGPFASIAEQLQTVVSKFGLTVFGAKGDPFDPNRHEAVAHMTSPDVTEPTCIDVMRRGYLLGERLLRPAMVAVADPESE